MFDAIRDVVTKGDTPEVETSKLKDALDVKPLASVNVTVYVCAEEPTVGVPVIPITTLLNSC